MDQTIAVTLVIKGDREQVEKLLCEKMNDWMIADHSEGPPYPDGSLLFWNYHVVERGEER